MNEETHSRMFKNRKYCMSYVLVKFLVIKLGRFPGRFCHYIFFKTQGRNHLLNANCYCICSESWMCCSCRRNTQRNNNSFKTVCVLSPLHIQSQISWHQLLFLHSVTAYKSQTQTSNILNPDCHFCKLYLEYFPKMGRANLHLCQKIKKH